MKGFGFVLLFLTSFSLLANNVICLVDVQAAVAQEKEAQHFLAELAKEDAGLSKRQEEARVSLETDMAKVQKELSKMSDKNKMDKEEEFRKRITALQEKFSKEHSDLERKKLEMQKQVEDKNKFLIESIAKKENCDLVINEAAVPYANNKVKRITSNLSAEYNKIYPVPAAPKKANESKQAPTKK